MGPKYVQIAVELWRRLLASQAPKWGVDFREPSPIDQYAMFWPDVLKIIHGIEMEFHYKMTKHQCSWSLRCYFEADYDEYVAATSVPERGE